MDALSNRQLEIVYRLWPSGEIPNGVWRAPLREACARHRVPCPSRAELLASGFRFTGQPVRAPGRRTPAGPFRGTRRACPWCAGEIVLPHGYTLVTSPYCSPGCAAMALAFAHGIAVPGRRPPGSGWDPPAKPGVLTRRYSTALPDPARTSTARTIMEVYPPRYVR